MKTILFTILLALFASIPVAAQQIDEPKLTPSPATEMQKMLIREGVALHDRGDYDGARAKYEQVLRENPNNVLALYELAFSYNMKKDFRKSLELAYKGAQYKSDELIGFYMLIGNNLDELNEPKKAVEVYKQAIRLKPDTPLLYYNLALTYTNLNNSEEARKNYKKALFLNPNHASSHLALANVFYNSRYKTPALFAVMRFLVLEPKSQRSLSGYKLLAELLRAGVGPGKNGADLHISVDAGGSKDEGDFTSMEIILSLSNVATSTEKNKGKSEVERLVHQLDTFLAVVSGGDSKADNSKFTWRYYIPYFVELKKRNYVAPFGYYISQSSNSSGVQEWLEANAGLVREFVSWSKSYRWPVE